MIKIGLCEDNKAYNKLIKKMTTAYFENKAEVSIQEISSEALSSGSISVDDLDFDIFILGLNLTYPSGIISRDYLLARLHRFFPSCMIVSIVDSPSHFSSTVDTSHIYYVLDEQLELFYPLALEKIHMHLQYLKPEFLFYKRSQSVYRIALSDIIYMERNKHHTLVHCVGSEHVLVRNLNSLMEQIRLYPYIVRCHNSYAVNLAHVDIYSRNEFILTQDYHVPISRHYVKEIRDQIQLLL